MTTIIKSTVETTLKKRPSETPSSLIKDSKPHNCIALVYALLVGQRHFGR